MIVPDPRVFAVHKYWLADRTNRPRDRRERDRAQAELVAQLVTRFLTHLSPDLTDLRMVPAEHVEKARPLFQRSAMD